MIWLFLILFGLNIILAKLFLSLEAIKQKPRCLNPVNPVPAESCSAGIRIRMESENANIRCIPTLKYKSLCLNIKYLLVNLEIFFDIVLEWKN